MRRKHRTENYSEQKDPDCSTCADRKDCARAQEGSFCTRWRREKAQMEGPDPNELWKQGEDVSF